MLRLALAVLATQAGFQAYTASLPLALARAGVPDAQIGLIVGASAVVMAPTALIVGALLDRLGGIRVFALGIVAYGAGSLLVLAPGTDPGGSLLPFALARVCQGIGLGASLPSALWLVGRLAPAGRQGLGLGFVQSANNLAGVLLPGISIAILDAWSLRAVAGVACAGIAAGSLLLVFVARRAAGPSRPSAPGARPRVRVTFRRSWASPLAIACLYLVHWGVLTAYLPQRAEAAGGNVGLFFAADGLVILLSRVPSGWLADRIAARNLIVAGLGITAAALGVLFVDPTTPILVLAGAGTGLGGGLIITPLLLNLTHRAGTGERGSALAIFSAAMAVALAGGSIVAAPVVAGAGFRAGLVVALVGVGCALLLSLADRRLAQAPTPAAADA